MNKNIGKYKKPDFDDNKSVIRELALEASRNGNQNPVNQNKKIYQIHNDQVESVKNYNENDDDNISDLENDSSEGIENSDKDMSNEFKENVIIYIKCDDLIRKRMQEIKDLKASRKPCEEFIIKYLQEKDAPFVNCKDGKLIKNKSESKGGLKIDIIKSAITEGIKSEKLTDDEVRAVDITSKIMNIMESKRPKVVRVNIKRTFQRKNAK